MTTKTKRIKLTDRNKELYDKLPKEYADYIFNSILARSAEVGLFLQEAKLYLSQEEFEKLQSTIGVRIPLQDLKIKSSDINRRKRKKVVEIKSSTEIKKEEIENSAFIF